MPQMSILDHTIQQHYTRPDLADAILSALAATGTDLNHLTLEDLAPVDEFHIRGREATIELARQLPLEAATHVLDIGSGLGGASRYLAQAYGCRVTGLDLTEAYCRVAQMLVDRLGLGSRVTYRHGSAVAMPFEDATFDVVWTQHASMNIADKATLYGEIRRVLRPGGIFACYDILAGSGGPLLFPVPWAREPSYSFLITPEVLREVLERTGFRITGWRDTSAIGRAWFQEVGAKMSSIGGSPPVGFHLLLGADFRSMVQNQVRNLNEQRILLIEALAQRP